MKSNEHQAAAATALLSAPVLRSAMTDGADAKLANRAISQLMGTRLAAGVTTVRALIWRCDRWLLRHYRNDLVYRKAVLSQLIPWSSEVILPEFRTNRSIVDFLSVSTVLHAVEIKSDLDDTRRLNVQLRDYMRVAPLVSLVAPSRIAAQVAGDEDLEYVGLYWLDSTGHLKPLRAARYNPSRLDPGTLMRSLRRNEYLAILEEFGSPLPTLPNTRVFSAAMQQTRYLDPERYQGAAAAQLRLRRPKAGRTSIAKLPEPVHATVLKLDPTKEQLCGLRAWFSQEIVNVYA